MYITSIVGRDQSNTECTLWSIS